MNDKDIRNMLKEFARVVVAEYKCGNPTINQQFDEAVRQINILYLLELRKLKQIDCFNEAYTTDPRPAKHIDIKIKELLTLLKNDPDFDKAQFETEGKNSWHIIDVNDDVPYGDPDK